MEMLYTSIDHILCRGSVITRTHSAFHARHKYATTSLLPLPLPLSVSVLLAVHFLTRCGEGVE